MPGSSLTEEDKRGFTRVGEQCDPGAVVPQRAPVVGPRPVDSPLAHDLVASLIARGAAKDAGLTWGMFKVAMRELGIQDSDRVASIEYGVKFGGSGHILREDASDGIEVREL